MKTERSATAAKQPKMSPSEILRSRSAISPSQSRRYWGTLDDDLRRAMPLPINVTALVHGKSVESERIEFKTGWNAEEVARTLCAFANDFQNWGGGYLVLGVESQEGRPVFPPKGLRPEQADAWQRKLLELGHTLRPAYHPISEVVEIAGKIVLVVWIPAGEMRPYEVPVS